jgi:hypothetical protein
MTPPFTAGSMAPRWVFDVLDEPMEPLGGKENGLSGIVGPGWGPAAKYAAPKIRIHLLDWSEKLHTKLLLKHV